LNEGNNDNYNVNPSLTTELKSADRSVGTNLFELTTYPSYEDNPDYIILKRELQEAVNSFINTGLTIMKKWSRININVSIPGVFPTDEVDCER
jgi:hypothetical protein